MLTLHGHCGHRECRASFTTIEGARACAAILQTRDKIHGVMLLTEDGERLALEDSPAT